MQGSEAVEQLSVMPGVETRAVAPRSGLVRLAEIADADWLDLADRAVEANGFFTPAFTRAAFTHAGPRQGGRLLVARARQRLAGLVPVVTARRAIGLPLPALFALQPYAPLGTPLIDAAKPVEAASALIAAAARSGAALLVLPKAMLDGAAVAAITEALARRKLAPTALNTHERAALACAGAPTDDETYLRGGMGAKKLKDLRRLRHRLDEMGEVSVLVHDTPDAVEDGLTRFLALEAAGWKGRNGTGLGQSEGDAAFIRAAAATESAAGRFHILELTLDGRAIGSGLMMRQGDTGFFFKIAYEETLSRLSPGVQLTVELTRRAFADPGLMCIDSTADPGHPMIDHVWRERLRVGDLLVPTVAGPLPRLVAGLIAARDAARSFVKSRIAGSRTPK